MNTWEVLERAADKIERDGWQQGAYGWPRCGPVCAEGALFYAIGDEYSYAAIHALHEAVGGHIPHWNDAPERTAAEVIAMLRAVAATEKARAARLMPVVRETVTA